MITLTDKELKCISKYVQSTYGIDLGKKKYLIESKLWIELAKYKADNYTEYWQMLLADSTGVMRQRMIDVLTTNYTYFCREEKHFSLLEQKIIPELSLPFGEKLRILSAGCASGQECYTIAMCLLDYKKQGILKVPFEVVGVDISNRMIKKAQTGEYESTDYARLPNHWKSEYCELFQNGKFHIKKEVQRYVKFYKRNLLQPYIGTKQFQIIFCRNVLIYFKERERERVIKNLVRRLTKDGYVLISYTESLNGIQGKLVYTEPSIYRKTGD